jgi:hypothetical protein
MPREDLIDVIGDRLHLTLGLARAEHQVISDRGKLGDVENEDVFGLLFQGRRGDGDRFGLRLRYDRFPPDTTSFGLYRIQLGQATALRALRGFSRGRGCPRRTRRMAANATA